jgi:hypothetical protein
MKKGRSNEQTPTKIPRDFSQGINEHLQRPMPATVH